ncbi:fimbrial assembly protein [Corynebacterium diphtheriae]|uniref:SpaA isopeptide-forming pilin-related protein n=2 Tax=Corynebacterium diphtheriae TaxID=1717 RepID=UPI0005EAEE43|nr:LPXTG cell wall anchor domain-containing protein [Corynebacterium diphtheriae]KJJ58816.1 fimbrial assembly protein [Corynebacterium diphtheriae]
MKDLSPRKRYGAFPLRAALALCTVSALFLGIVVPGGLPVEAAQEVAEMDGAEDTARPEATPEDAAPSANDPADSDASKVGSPAAPPAEPSDAKPEKVPAPQNLQAPTEEGEPAQASSDSRLIGGDWRKKIVEKNPPMPQRCGLRIALVFDLSNSVGENGLENTKISGQKLIKDLSYTPTTIGIFNFGTEAPVANTKDEPRLDLTNPSDVQTALSTIQKFDYGNHNHSKDDPYTDSGGTNWEGALRNVRKAGVHYDVVYFVTDGVPTTNIKHLPENVDGKVLDGKTHDTGRVTHNGDITLAMEEANKIKEGGTRIEVIAVGSFDGKVPVLRDNVQYDGLTRWTRTDTIWSNAAEVRSGTFWAVPTGSQIREPDLRSVFEKRVKAGVLDYFHTHEKADYYVFRLEDELSSVPTGEPFSENIRVYDYRQKRNVNKLFEGNVYRSNYAVGHDIMQKISGPAAEDVHFISNYDQLATKLRDLATESCESALTVQKQIVDEHGEIIDANPKGWKFTDTDIEGNLEVIRRDGVSGNEQFTDESGLVSYNFKSQSRRQNGTLTITETQKDGFELKKVGSDNAKCTEVDITSNSESSAKPIQIQNRGDLGFNVGIGTGKTVHCIVQNVKLDNTFKIKKVPHADQDKGTDGDQLKAPVNAKNEVTAYYDVEVTSNASRKLKLHAPVVDTMTFPQGMTIKNIEVFMGNKKIDDPAHIAMKASTAPNVANFEFMPALFDEFDAQEMKKVEVRVTASVDERTRLSISDESYERCESSTPRTADRPKSMFNAVRLKGESEGADPTFNNQACVDPELKRVDFTVQKIDGSDERVPLEGAEFTIFSGDAAVPQDWKEVARMQPKPGEASTLVLPRDANVTPGKYLLVETKAPKSADGRQYSLLVRPITFMVDVKGGKTEVEILEGTPVATVDSDNLSIIRVVNVYVGALPQTGGAGVGIIALLGMLLTLAGAFFARRSQGTSQA